MSNLRAFSAVKIILGLLLILGLGLAIGVTAERKFDFSRQAAAIAKRNLGWLSTTPGAFTEPDDRQTARREHSTHFYDLTEITIPLGPFDGGRGGSIAEFGDGFIFVEPHGQVGFVSLSGAARYEKIRVPMNMQGFVDWVETSDIGVYVHYFRTLDTLLKSEPSGATSLLVSYLRFSDKCVEFAVSSIGVELGKDGPVYDAQGWRDIFVAKPCVALPPKAQTFEGLESGGRLIQRGPNRLLISIGQFGFDGQLMTPAVSMDPSVDLGKILELDTDTGKASIVSMGHRNPQGLALDSDGHVWATEHGPNGGDELNLIVEGRNYGWPQTTYGLLSRNRRAEWPTNSVQGRHDTVYELPRFFFSPSIGVSNLIEVKGDEFPRWRGDLLVGSLVDATLYRIRREGNRIVSVERIAIGERIRDIILMRDHRVALLTDNGDIKILQQTQASLEPRQPLPDMRIAGFADIAAARSKDPLLGRQLTFHEQGRRLYVTNCASCHSLNGSAGVGPSLHNLVGRKIGSVEGYAYSSALREAKGNWTDARIHAFLSNPQREFPGTNMSGTTIHFNDIWAVIGYLKNPN